MDEMYEQSVETEGREKDAVRNVRRHDEWIEGKMKGLT